MGVFHKSKLRLILMQMVLLMYMQETRGPERNNRLLFNRQVDYLRMKLKIWSKTLKHILKPTKSSVIELKQSTKRREYFMTLKLKLKNIKTRYQLKMLQKLKKKLPKSEKLLPIKITWTLKKLRKQLMIFNNPL